MTTSVARISRPPTENKMEKLNVSLNGLARQENGNKHNARQSTSCIFKGVKSIASERIFSNDK